MTYDARRQPRQTGSIRPPHVPRIGRWTDTNISAPDRMDDLRREIARAQRIHAVLQWASIFAGAVIIALIGGFAFGWL